MPLFRRAVEIVVVRDPAPSTADLVLHEARRVEGLWHQLHAAMDQRAGVLLGFSGVLAALTFSTGVTSQLPRWAAISARLLIFGAALVSALPLFSRSLQTLSPGDLAEDYSDAPVGDVENVVTSQIAWIVDEAEARLRWKTAAVRGAAALLVASVLTVAVGSIVNGIEPAAEPTPAPTSQGGGAT